jgi:hypothetical protein
MQEQPSNWNHCPRVSLALNPGYELRASPNITPT